MPKGFKSGPRVTEGPRGSQSRGSQEPQGSYFFSPEGPSGPGLLNSVRNLVFHLTEKNPLRCGLVEFLMFNLIYLKKSDPACAEN